MAIKPKDIYKGRQKSRRAAKSVIIAVLVLIVLMIALFFGLRKYAVYDESGNATIVWPWEKGTTDTAVEPQQE